MATKPSLIIGLHGLAGSGKSHVAKQLTDWYQYRVVRFADPLKQMLSTLLRSHGLSEVEIRRHIEGDLKEVPSPYLNGKTLRHAMQTLGAEWGRDLFGPDLWVNNWRKRIQLFDRVVVDDVRYENEAAAIRNMGGFIWHIQRRDRTRDPGEHSSEVPLTVHNSDLYIDNNGSSEALEVAVESCMDIVLSIKAARHIEHQW